jgi:hypothetical protein
LVPSIQIAFAAWFLNPWLRKGLDPAAVRHATNSWFVAFASVVGLFLLAGAAAWITYATRVQKSSWHADGTPQFGKPRPPTAEFSEPSM